MEQKSVVLGFSGGIDSCTAARCLLDDGYRVVALTIDTLGDIEMMRKAEIRALEIGVEWIGYDARERFKREIIDYFTSSYLEGKTPAPCTRCNTRIKWNILLEVADRMQIEHIATGHYFCIEEHDGRYYVAKGADSIKDQSYYLWGLGQEVLSRALTPMGNKIKSEVKLSFQDKSESMGICFLRGRHYSDFLRDRCGELAGGNIVDTSGRILAHHNGIALYTAGQKRGEGIPEGYRVLYTRAEDNAVVVGSGDSLYKYILYITQCNIVSESDLLFADDITIKIRGIGRNPQLPVKVECCSEGYKVTTNDPVWAPAAGQPLVFYRKNLVIGGGTVVSFD